MDYTYYHLPSIEYSPIDCVNRVNAATGSIRSAQNSEYASWNGHRLVISKNLRGYYTCEYFWGGRHVLCRDHDIIKCLEEALSYYKKGALGSSINVVIRGEELSSEAIAFLNSHFLVGECPNDDQLPWWTWKHSVARRCTHLGALIFDWDIMNGATNENEYKVALRAKHGRNYINMFSR